MSFKVWDFPVKIVEGLGSTSMVGSEAARLDARSVIIITDEGVRRAGLVDGVQASLQDAGIPVAIFDAVEQDPCGFRENHQAKRG